MKQKIRRPVWVDTFMTFLDHEGMDSSEIRESVRRVMKWYRSLPPDISVCVDRTLNNWGRDDIGCLIDGFIAGVSTAIGRPV